MAHPHGPVPAVARKSARAPRRSRRRAPGFWSRSSDTSGSIPGNGILHLPKSVLDVVLRAISQHNVFIQPVGVIGEQNGFAELNSAETVQHCLVGGIGI